MLKLAWRFFAAGFTAMLLLAGPGPAVRADEDVPELKFTELYKGTVAPGTPVNFSDKTMAMAGKQVMLRGYMAPPLKATGEFFVLTKTPVSLCPFCDTDLDWPADIAVIYNIKGKYSPEAKLKIVGTLELGSKTDESTGFVSQLRLMNAEVVR